MPEVSDLPWEWQLLHRYEDAFCRRLGGVTRYRPVGVFAEGVGIPGLRSVKITEIHEPLTAHSIGPLASPYLVANFSTKSVDCQ